MNTRTPRHYVRPAACLLAAFAALGPAPRSLWAQPAQPNASRADALFREGRRLLDENKLDEACPKFAESQRLDPSSGTLLNLGDCYERQGRYASAIDAFSSASKLASGRNDAEHSAEGQRRASLLEKKVSLLLVRVSGATPGLTVKQNDTPVDPSKFGSGVPIDPGHHVIKAEAAGYAPFLTDIKISAPGQVVVYVPALAPLAPKGAEPPKATEPPSGGPPIAGYVVGGLGVAALGVGAAFGAMALSNYSKAEDQCKEGSCPDRSAAEKTIDKADGQAWVSNVGLGVGLVGAAVGGYLLFFSPSKKPSAPAGPGVGLRLAPAGTGLGVGGRF